jgi:hypothetical protein
VEAARTGSAAKHLGVILLSARIPGLAAADLATVAPAAVTAVTPAVTPAAIPAAAATAKTEAAAPAKIRLARLGSIIEILLNGYYHQLGRKDSAGPAGLLGCFGKITGYRSVSCAPLHLMNGNHNDSPAECNLKLAQCSGESG